MSKITTHPNQRVYRVYKDIKANSAKVVIDKIDFQEAYKVLTPTELAVWLDMMGNKEDSTWAFSPQDYANRYGMSVSGARAAFNGLINKGFAVSIGKNGYKILSKSIYATAVEKDIDSDYDW